MIAAALGFLAPFLPDLIGMGKGWVDHKQELQMMKLRLDHAAQEHDWRMDLIHEQAALQSQIAARKPHQSYGVQILNAAQHNEGLINGWVFSIAFIMFSALDWFISSVRPTVSYFIFGVWGSVKLASLLFIYEQKQDLVLTLSHPLAFTDFDQELMLLIVAFWFGDRTRRRVMEK